MVPVARSTEPRVLYTNFSLLTVTDRTAPPVEKNPVRVAVLAHIYYPDMVDELMSYIDNIPRPYDLIVTTPTQERADAIEEALSRTSLRPAVDTTHATAPAPGINALVNSVTPREGGRMLAR